VEIHSQGDPRGRIDFRLALAENPSALPHVVHELPARVSEQVLALVRALNLVTCAIDMVVTPAGDYVFLEVNPSGQFGWIEGLTGLPITAELVGLLMRGRE
jgi:glutathione synthase/RimK-type ligase-like ATP-grasp enzyme